MNYNGFSRPLGQTLGDGTMMKLATMTMEDDSKFGTRAPEAPEPPHENPIVFAPHASDAPRVIARGRRLRKLLIIGNIVAWILLILAVRAIFF